jgi:hypothetical protein
MVATTHRVQRTRSSRFVGNPYLTGRKGLPVTLEQSQSCQARDILPIGHLAVARNLFLREFGGDFSTGGAEALRAFAS